MAGSLLAVPEVVEVEVAVSAAAVPAGLVGVAQTFGQFGPVPGHSDCWPTKWPSR